MQLKRAKYQWQLQTLKPEEMALVEELILKLPHFSSNFIKLCVSRGLTSVEAIQLATDPKPQLFHDAKLMYDMEKAVERIHEAIAAEEAILIYGDYDADGITSTLILLESLEALGANVHYYLPNRLTDGYGPNTKRWLALCAEYQIQLLITCDNGVTGHEAVQALEAQGVDVIITDHHEIQESLPAAYAVIHPRHPQGSYPFGDLSGAGVALKLASALLDEVPTEALELAAIGSVADMVSLVDENRTIVLSGLKLMTSSPRLGLKKMLNEVDKPGTGYDTDTIGFGIGPRLNAIGRLGDPSPALELLRSENPAEVDDLWQLINQKNGERQEISQKIVKSVEAKLNQMGALPDIIIASQPDWPAGILGIVASNISKKYHRPTLLFQELTDKGLYKGSGRSIEKLNLFDIMYPLHQDMLHFGGHSQAVGLSIKEENWGDFQQNLQEAMQSHRDLLEQVEELTLDLSLPLKAISTHFIQEIQQLGPFGQDNPKPKFLFEDVTLEQFRRIGSDQSHVKLTLSEEEGKIPLQAVGFRMAANFEGVQTGQKLSLVGELSLNEWQNQVNPQLILRDVGQAKTVWRDFRASRINPQLFTINQAIYLFQRPHIAERLQASLAENSLVMLYDEKPPLNLTSYSSLVVMEPPSNLGKLSGFLQAADWETIYLGSFVQHSLYMAGIPQRNDVIKVYQYIQQEAQLGRAATEAAINQLLNSMIKTKLILKMFSEADFGRMDNGSFSLHEKLPSMKQDLTATQAYQNFIAAYYAEALLNYEPLNKIIQYFEGEETDD